jgi:glycosyltransferase, group 2 family protein
MESKASVSIVLCTYNGEKYVREQIDSLLAQSYPIHEIIIQDDGSTDQTWEILQSYASKHAVIRTFKNEGEHGVNANFLSALHRAKGDYIAISDQDDIWERDKIETQMRCIEDKLLCSGHSRPFSTDGSFAYFDNRPRNVNIFRMMFLGLPGHTLLCKRALINLLPPLESPVFKVTLYDAVLSIIAASYDSIVYCNKVLVNFRRHAAATTYNDYSSSLPSWRNALTELTWSLNHYKKIRKKVVPIFQGKLMLMEGLHSNIHDFIEAREAMRMETKQGVFAFLRLQYLLTKNYKKLFHTSGGGPIKLLRAMLYPIMQLYMYH